jgi:hypothetical protein
VSDKSTILSIPLSITHLSEAILPPALYTVTNDSTLQMETYLRLKLLETHPATGILYSTPQA